MTLVEAWSHVVLAIHEAEGIVTERHREFVTEAIKIFGPNAKNVQLVTVGNIEGIEVATLSALIVSLCFHPSSHVLIATYSSECAALFEEGMFGDLRLTGPALTYICGRTLQILELESEATASARHFADPRVISVADCHILSKLLTSVGPPELLDALNHVNVLIKIEPDRIQIENGPSLINSEDFAFWVMKYHLGLK